MGMYKDLDLNFVELLLDEKQLLTRNYILFLYETCINAVVVAPNRHEVAPSKDPRLQPLEFQLHALV